jgi:hypothetical protein
MRYFKHIDLDNYQLILENSRRFVSDEYGTYLNNKKSLFQQISWKTYLNHCPEILTSFSKYELQPIGGFIYIIFTQDIAPLHIDYINKFNKCRINIPIYNCEHSHTEYYRIIDTFSKNTNSFYKNTETCRYIKYDENDPNLEKVDEVVVDRPTVMRVQEPHRVIINSDYVPRVVLTFRTNKDPVYLLEEVEDAIC